jgi:hypothetical protein
VTAVSANDVWAVGVTYSGGFDTTVRGLAEHWDGTSWSVVPTPAPYESEALNAVDAVSANSVWAAGAASGPGDIPLVERWDGSQWQVVPPPAGSFGLNALTANSDNDVWAGGEQLLPDDRLEAVLVHWNGSGWTRASVLGLPDTSSSIYGLDARTTDDVWAVGDAGGIPLILHWNGTRWRVVPSSGPAGTSSQLNDVDVRTASDAWAVGSSFSESAGRKTLVMRWNGLAWKIVRSPNPDSVGDGLGGVAALTGGNAWAVGGSADFPGSTLTEHWNGRRWQVVPSPDVGTTSSLADVAAVASSDIWAVGTTGTGALQSALIEHRC